MKIKNEKPWKIRDFVNEYNVAISLSCLTFSSFLNLFYAVTEDSLGVLFSWIPVTAWLIASVYSLLRYRV